jgi:hypothetical protein
MIEILILISAGATIMGALLGLVALYQACGMATLWLAVGAIYLLYAGLQRRGASFYDPGGVFGGGPVLPAPSTQRLPAPGARQIGKSQRSALPGPKM